MRKVNLTAVAALASLATLMTGQNAKASTTVPANLSVSANVPTNCTITAGTLAFGSYDALTTNAAAPLNQTGTFTINCTKNTAYTVALTLGTNGTGTTRRMVNASDGTFLTYEIYNEATRTTVWNATNTLGGTSAGKGATVTFTAYGQIPANQDATVGNYTDTVVEQVTF
jgi:spore coat protein U-like protein